jgi:hypothetical protein
MSWLTTEKKRQSRPRPHQRQRGLRAQEWAKKFGVTPERLKAAVKTSGPMVKDIEALLGKKL